MCHFLHTCIWDEKNTVINVEQLRKCFNEIFHFGSLYIWIGPVLLVSLPTWSSTRGKMKEGEKIFVLGFCIMGERNS